MTVPILDKAISENFVRCPIDSCGSPLHYNRINDKIFCDGCGRFEYDNPSLVETLDEEDISIVMRANA